MSKFCIIGAEMPGLLMAIRLKQAGFEAFTVYEKSDKPGGTWRDDTYPGVTCDVPSHYYNYSFFPIHYGRKNFRQDKRYNNIFIIVQNVSTLSSIWYLILR